MAEDQVRRDRAFYKSPEYKRECRARRAAKDGRGFRPGVPGRFPTLTPPTPEQAARAAWRDWVAHAPAEWLLVYGQAIKSGRARRKAAAVRLRYHRDPEAERQRIRRYKHSNPGRVAEWGGRRWQRARDLSDGTVSKGQVDQLLSSRRTCPYCFAAITPVTAQLDHIIPLVLGGLHSVVNLVACCGSCNGRKNAKPFADWAASLPSRGRASAERLYRSRYGLDVGDRPLL